MNEPQTILVIDDDEILRHRLEKAFTRRGFRVFVAHDYDAAIEAAAQHQPHRAVLDLKMPGKNGLEVLDELLKVSPDTKVVILTGYGSITNAVEATKIGAVNYITKPADADQVLSAFTPGPSPSPEFPPPSLAEAQWEHIQRVLADCGGNISEAARRLDIPRRTLQRKLKKTRPNRGSMVSRPMALTSQHDNRILASAKRVHIFFNTASTFIPKGILMLLASLPGCEFMVTRRVSEERINTGFTLLTLRVSKRVQLQKFSDENRSKASLACRPHTDSLAN